MSTGALTQLAALGSQDQYLSVAGEITFFKGVYRRHTNFAKESVTMQFNQSVQWGSKSSCTISRTGDLLSKTWLHLTLPALNKPENVENWLTRHQISLQEFSRDPEIQKRYYLAGEGNCPHARYCDEVGHAIIDKVDLVIGGTLIDSHPGHYLQVWNELTQTPEKKQIAHLVGRSGTEAELEELAQSTQYLYVPLQFFFCRHLMQALPLIALQYHEVKIDVTFKNIEDVVAFPGYKMVTDEQSGKRGYVRKSVTTTGNRIDGYKSSGPITTTTDMLVSDGTIDYSQTLATNFVPTGGVPRIDESGVASSPNYANAWQICEMPTKSQLQLSAELLCNLVYLEEDERKTFAGSTHEYLVDLLQFQGPHVVQTGEQTTYHAYFNHPTSELIWTFVPKVAIDSGEPFNYSALQKSYNAAGDPMKTAKLQFNGYDRFSQMSSVYFRELVPAQYHTSVPTRQIYVYSFALEPEDFRPSGSVNLSRIDNVKLITTHINFYEGEGLFMERAMGHQTSQMKGGELRVYARSKNVLRIKSGMAGLAYAN